MIQNQDSRFTIQNQDSRFKIQNQDSIFLSTRPHYPTQPSWQFPPDKLYTKVASRHSKILIMPRQTSTFYPSDVNGTYLTLSFLKTQIRNGLDSVITIIETEDAVTTVPSDLSQDSPNSWNNFPAKIYFTAQKNVKVTYIRTDGKVLQSPLQNLKERGFSSPNMNELQLLKFEHIKSFVDGTYYYLSAVQGDVETQSFTYREFQDHLGNDGKNFEVSFTNAQKCICTFKSTLEGEPERQIKLNKLLQGDKSLKTTHIKISDIRREGSKSNVVLSNLVLVNGNGSTKKVVDLQTAADDSMFYVPHERNSHITYYQTSSNISSKISVDNFFHRGFPDSSTVEIRNLLQMAFKSKDATTSTSGKRGRRPIGETAMKLCIETGMVPEGGVPKQKLNQNEVRNPTNEEVASVSQEIKNTPNSKRMSAPRKQNSSNEKEEASRKPNISNENLPERSCQVEASVFLGRKFKNPANDCYVNSVVNLVLSSEAVRQGVIDEVCQCTLCEKLRVFLNDASKSHNARALKMWVANFNPAIFGGDNLNRQQDAEEFLSYLITNCRNLNEKTTFETVKLRKCNNENCLHESRGPLEKNRKILSCHMNTAENDLNITEDMVNSSMSIDYMICQNCKLMARETGSSHETKEVFSSLPSKVFIMSVKRFEYDQLYGQGRKIGNAVHPSSTILLKKNGQEEEFYLKSVVEHHGMSLASGHYTSKLHLSNKWLICNDSEKVKVSGIEPLGGYLFLYEKTPLHVSQDTLAALLAGIEEQNQQEIDINNPPPRNMGPNTSNTAKDKPKETPLESETDPVESVNVEHFSRSELIKMLESMKVAFGKNRNTSDLRIFLKKKLELKHPIHEFLKSLEILKLKDVVMKISMKYDQSHDMMRRRIANHFFEKSPSSPLAALKKIINDEEIPGTCSEPKKRKIDKSNPIIQYLKIMEENEIKEIARKLGNNRLRNHDRMRAWIAQFFFDIDQISPLKSLKKFLNGELPELDATQKKEPTKRKSEGGSGPSAKKAKLNLEEVKENQEKLKKIRKTCLESVAKKESPSSFYVDNPIIEAGVKFKEEMSKWKQEEACKICEESWFDQENASNGPNTGVCKRCRYDKDKECPTFSRLNEMIPGEQPECLRILNNIEIGAIRLIIPYVNVFKNKAGGRGFSGHSISFFQDVASFAQKLPDKLPRPIEDLQIILMRESKVTGKKREFKANGSIIRTALNWLIKNCPDYKEIEIDEENLSKYPSEGGNIDIPTYEDEAVEENGQSVDGNRKEKPKQKPEENTEKSPFDNEDEEMLLAYEEYEEKQGDVPKPSHAVNENIAQDTIDNYVKKAIEEIQVGKDSSEPDKISWPEQDDEPVSDFSYGYFTKCFPHLFPDGMADISKTRPGNQPPMKQWVRHLLKVDRRFARDPFFILVVTNIMQKKRALALGNLYVDRCLSDKNLEEINQALKEGDEKTLRSLYCYSSSIEGSQQYFSQKISMAYSFLRHVRISSGDKEMFNSFFTFSAADLHWDELHKLLPGHERYIGKRIVKNLEDVEESERENCITEVEDWILRYNAIDQNQDIVNAYFQKRVKTIWDEVLKPIFGGKYYIMRYEFQHRGCIHCHMVFSMENGPTFAEMELALKDLPEEPKVPEWTTREDSLFQTETEKEKFKQEKQENYERDLCNYNEIRSAKMKMIEFNSLVLGVNAVHPELNFENWPAPRGKNAQRPLSNVLKEDFRQHLGKPEDLSDYRKRLIDRVMIHKCKKGSCLTETFKTVKNNEGKKEIIKEKHCRFNFPFDLNGFKLKFNEETEELEGYDPDIKEESDPLSDPLHFGASYRKLDEKTQKFIDTKLELLRNHPELNNHIAEVLILWGANVDQKCITSYEQVVQYLLKYVLKPEKGSEFFTSLKAAIAKKVDDDTPLKKTATKVLMSCIGQRDMTSNECFLIAHGHPYVEFSQAPRTANLKGSSVAKKKLKDESECIQDDDNFTEAYWKREEIDGYKQLCTDYEAGKMAVLTKHPRDLSLREFMCNFTKKWNYCPAEVFPYIIPTFRYVVKKGKENYEEYCRCLLLQDKPGCSFDNVGKMFGSCEEELKDFVENSPFCPNLVKEEFKESQKSSSNIQQEQDPFVFGDSLYIEPEGKPERALKDDYMHLHELANDKDLEDDQEDEYENHDPNYCDTNVDKKDFDRNEDRIKLNMNTEDYLLASSWIGKMKQLHSNIGRKNNDDINSLSKDQLNFKQRIVYDLIENWVTEKVEGKDVAPLYLNLSGRAGCGKSAVLNCVSKYIRSIVKPTFMKIGAPTGTAAFLVKGNTLHTLFHLPINSSKNELPDLSGQRLRDFQEAIEDVELVVIDEKSMIGQYCFYMIDARLRQAKPARANQPFGGVSMVLMGDFAQLTPVGDPPLFMEPDEKTKNGKNPQVITGYHLFKEHFSENSIIFDEVMRQGPDQKEFKEVLDNIAMGKFTKENWNVLRRRNLRDPANFTNEERKAIKAKSVKICARIKDTKRHNIERIVATGNPVLGLKSLNAGGKEAKRATANEAQGLLQDIIIAKGCKVLLTRNLWSDAGLTNGCRGEVRYIVYPEDWNGKDLPMVICHFPLYIGPSYIEDEPKCVPIVIQESHFNKNKELCIRKMLPLKPGYAISIHSSQGATLESVIVNLGPREFATGLTYVAPSRVRKIENLYFDPMPHYGRFTGMAKSKVFAQRRKQDEREKISDAKYAQKAREKNENRESESDQE